ncbi:MAG: hypothetical protein DI630_30850 [Gordonia sp. (in: high G+C Gram-positive bacteria)]|nr:MAG: hypothetical protein DI630_30850 [Gordonia sp. (in: high G+C Gram-positive bacteria)]
MQAEAAAYLAQFADQVASPRPFEDWGRFLREHTTAASILACCTTPQSSSPVGTSNWPLTIGI